MNYEHEFASTSGDQPIIARIVLSAKFRMHSGILCFHPFDVNGITVYIDTTGVICRVYPTEKEVSHYAVP